MPNEDKTKPIINNTPKISIPKNKNMSGRRDLWLMKQLDTYEANYSQSNIDEVKKRVILVQENILPIQRLLLKYPERWPKLNNTLELFKEKMKMDWEKRNDEINYHKLSYKEKEYLKKSLMLTNLKLSKLKVPLPSPVFNAIYRFIENKEFEYLLDKKSISYIMSLTEQKDPPLNWDKKLYGFLRKYLRKEIMR
ncbi:MAG: hypothetical protein APG08_00099 [Candidatus Methanofastidiosum methylothiophilum]|mgnify:CR=1 FL=1|jgi:hypothetical protein|uniref:Uncharacterized protein n=1 Tax=Candidatus Methanofastidiosum methylothiophilum TaxID=1705564 RepID=A0A150JK71_9EURY|nr:MAG: hypothetical protein AN188_00136 [Candidatus Methanofastidiosum methylthiophilus]MBP6932377.1 hypothetical protein [Methanofastidiosum sp.]OQC49672.1 MAG: hypothetical protein BWX56_01474 [Euryarchaeota archaeon ADurb.Bin023]KYC57630.1 MAG: hypothetical protein APG08_00099 [Candidatus Methanofastidiosum methylthiophilus]KYC58481.1 MAG: hypothetical protein APG09_00228 [Candidatus Methanofastidiosum methylthiophilus]